MVHLECRSIKISSIANRIERERERGRSRWWKISFYLHKNARSDDIFVAVRGAQCGAIFFCLFSLARKLRSWNWPMSVAREKRARERRETEVSEVTHNAKVFLQKLRAPSGAYVIFRKGADAGATRLTSPFLENRVSDWRVSPGCSLARAPSRIMLIEIWYTFVQPVPLKRVFWHLNLLATSNCEQISGIRPFVSPSGDSQLEKRPRHRFPPHSCSSYLMSCITFDQVSIRNFLKAEYFMRAGPKADKST